MEWANGSVGEVVDKAIKGGKVLVVVIEGENPTYPKSIHYTHCHRKLVLSSPLFCEFNPISSGSSTSDATTDQLFSMLDAAAAHINPRSVSIKIRAGSKTCEQFSQLFGEVCSMHRFLRNSSP